jgi:hypothetical protein
MHRGRLMDVVAKPLTAQNRSRLGRRWFRLSLAGVSIAIAFAFASVQESARTSAAALPTALRQCSSIWTPPETLMTRAGVPVHVDQLTSVAPLGPSLLLLGSPAYVWNPISAPPRTEMQRVDGRLLGVSAGPGRILTEIPKPPFMGRNSAVWARPATNAAVHVVWGVPADTNAPPFREVSSVWYARFDGVRWSAPEQIMSGTPIRWRWSGSVLSTGEDVVVAAPAFDALGNGVVSARRTRGAWATTRFRSPGFPPSAVALVVEDSQAVVFYPMWGPGNDTVGLYVRRLVRGGSWTDAALVKVVTPVATTPGIAATRTPDGTYHLFWTQHAGRDPDMIHHTSSRDLIAWRASDGLSIGGGLYDFTVAANGPSAVRLVARTRVHKHLATTMWTIDGPGRLEELSFVDPATPPTLTAFGLDTLVLTWGTVWLKREPDNVMSPGLVTVYSRSVRSCR